MEFKLDARLSASYARCTMTKFDLFCYGSDHHDGALSASEPAKCTKTELITVKRTLSGRIVLNVKL